MSFPVLVRGLRKSFGRQQVLHGIDLMVPAGSVFALLGRNGAGKSTTMRILLGLLDADEGEVGLLGQSIPADRMSILANVGSMIEQPSLYESLTARENLKLDAAIRGLRGIDIDRALEIVELDDTRQPVRQYSLGMKQRLALAHAILGQPALLLLDEPTNGLDPMGIADMRRLLRELPQRLNTTVLLSTHLLGEVEQVATDLCVLEKGVLRYSGSLAELQSRERRMLRMKCAQDNVLQEWLCSNGCHVYYDEGRRTISTPVDDELQAGHLLRRMIQSGLPVYHAAFESRSLEEIYFDMIGLSSTGTREAVA